MKAHSRCCDAAALRKPVRFSSRSTRLDGRAALFGPAPQTELAESVERGVDRVFTRVHREEWVEPLEAERRLKREIDFDPDLWIVEIEDRQGRAFRRSRGVAAPLRAVLNRAIT